MYASDAGVITIGRGLVDRLEVSVEVIASPNQGHGRQLITESLRLTDVGEVVFAQVAPGNARR